MTSICLWVRTKRSLRRMARRFGSWRGSSANQPMAVNPDEKVKGSAGLYKMDAGGYRARFEYRDQFGGGTKKGEA